jgi:hypothetical protein
MHRGRGRGRSSKLECSPSRATECRNTGVAASAGGADAGGIFRLHNSFIPLSPRHLRNSGQNVLSTCTVRIMTEIEADAELETPGAGAPASSALGLEVSALTERHLPWSTPRPVVCPRR